MVQFEVLEWKLNYVRWKNADNVVYHYYSKQRFIHDVILERMETGGGRVSECWLIGGWGKGGLYSYFYTLPS